jgi:D-lyxose ketol-isomerase
MAEVTRRDWMAHVAVGAAAAGLAATGLGCEGMKREAQVQKQPNAKFYKADGTFDQDAAKQAYFDLMKAHGYPVYENLKKNLWVLDFALGKFTEVGMGGIFWINEFDEAGKYGYLGHEIFLLPGQMIPEHWHVKQDNVAPKIEGWQCRHGETILFGEGEESPEARKIIPASEYAQTTARHMTRVPPGEVGKLNRPEAPHSQVGGPQGAIVTEYATYHTMEALRFRNPKIKL